jgi:hypothetical protein
MVAYDFNFIVISKLCVKVFLLISCVTYIPLKDY